jgi:formiminotetrahydrofolate cyclodeaminase
VCRLTVTKKQYASVKEELTGIRDQADALCRDLRHLVVTDEKAFTAVMDAYKLPKGSDEQTVARDQAVQDATKGAASVPLQVMKTSLDALKLARIVAEKGNQNSITDAGVAGLMGHSAVEGAGYNVRINLTSINDQVFVSKLSGEVAAVRKEAATIAEEIRQMVEAKL